jgi:hypothetical protein
MRQQLLIPSRYAFGREKKNKPQSNTSAQEEPSTNLHGI